MAKSFELSHEMQGCFELVQDHLRLPILYCLQKHLFSIISCEIIIKQKCIVAEFDETSYINAN